MKVSPRRKPSIAPKHSVNVELIKGVLRRFAAVSTHEYDVIDLESIVIVQMHMIEYGASVKVEVILSRKEYRASFQSDEEYGFTYESEAKNTLDDAMESLKREVNRGRFVSGILDTTPC